MIKKRIFASNKIWVLHPWFKLTQYVLEYMTQKYRTLFNFNFFQPSIVIVASCSRSDLISGLKNSFRNENLKKLDRFVGWITMLSFVRNGPAFEVNVSQMWHGLQYQDGRLHLTGDDVTGRPPHYPHVRHGGGKLARFTIEIKNYILVQRLKLQGPNIFWQYFSMTKFAFFEVTWFEVTVINSWYPSHWSL